MVGCSHVTVTHGYVTVTKKGEELKKGFNHNHVIMKLLIFQLLKLYITNFIYVQNI